ncbi:MAG: ribonuclease Z [Chloroflexota bacterium]
MLDVCLLGTGGMQPLPGRPLSAVLARVGAHLILLDCGEGTQVTLRAQGWGLRRLSTILVTHLHADHVLGLPGLLLTLGHAGKGAGELLTIYGPEGLSEVLQGLLTVAPRLPYPVEMRVLQPGETVRLPGKEHLTVRCIGVVHDVPCLAYALELARAPRFDPDRARALGLPLALWRKLQAGESVEGDGRTITPQQVHGPPRRGLRVVLATDTLLHPPLTRFVAGDGEGTDLLIAEGMYGDAAQKPARWAAQHMTFAEAARLARDGHARRLWLTHFSPALSDPAAYLHHATAIFPGATLGQDGMAISLAFSDD